MDFNKLILSNNCVDKTEREIERGCALEGGGRACEDKACDGGN